MELALGGYAGFHTTTPPTPESAYGVYWPTLVPAAEVAHTVVLPDGTAIPVPPAAPAAAVPSAAPVPPVYSDPAAPVPSAAPFRSDSSEIFITGPTAEPSPVAPASPGAAAAEVTRAPLGRLCGARSGDKGGNANIGLWTRDPAAYPWLRDYLTVDRLRMILPECAGLDVRRYELPNLSALNFVVVGLLGEGVAASTRPDPQAKGLGEYLRSRTAAIPSDLLSP
jgi:hypothetical protein